MKFFCFHFFNIIEVPVDPQNLHLLQET